MSSSEWIDLTPSQLPVVGRTYHIREKSATVRIKPGQVQIEWEHATISSVVGRILEFVTADGERWQLPVKGTIGYEFRQNELKAEPTQAEQANAPNASEQPAPDRSIDQETEAERMALATARYDERKRTECEQDLRDLAGLVVLGAMIVSPRLVDGNPELRTSKAASIAWEFADEFVRQRREQIDRERIARDEVS